MVEEGYKQLQKVLSLPSSPCVCVCMCAPAHACIYYMLVHMGNDDDNGGRNFDLVAIYVTA